MILNLIKKYCKEGDKIILFTEDKTFEGIILSFEEVGIMLDINDSIELINKEIIKRFSIPKIRENVQNTEIVNNSILKPESIQVITNNGNTLDNGKQNIIDKQSQNTVNENREKKANLKSTLSQHPTIIKNPADLKNLILPAYEEENKLTLPATGVIIKNISNSKGGIIRDEFGNDIWFWQSDIIDNSITQSLIIAPTRVNIPVIFKVINVTNREKAVLISKPKKVLDLINIVKDFQKEGKYKEAIGILEMILRAFPENLTAIRNLDELTKKEKKTVAINNSTKKIYRYYQEAVRLKNVEKNNKEALKYYKLALENNEKRESCIKDIGMLLVTMDQREEALNFIKKYKNELQPILSTYFYLENLYFSSNDYISSIKYLNLILENKLISKDKLKYSAYLSKKGYALIQLDKIKEAKEILNEAILINPQGAYAINLLRALEEPNLEKLKLEIDFAEFDRYGGGVSRFIKELLENYEDYHGVPAKIIDNNDFKLETLIAIRRLIDTAGKARPRERANYLLTEAKLMMELEPEKANELRSVLARYCNAMALNHIYENTNMDVIRNYYLEAFSLEEEYKYTAKQLAIYLLTYKESYSDLISQIETTVDNALETLFRGDVKEFVWEGILSMFLFNREISAKIIAKIFANRDYKRKSFIYLNMLGFNFSNDISIEEYKDLWNQARERRQREYQSWFALIKAIEQNNNLENLIKQLMDTTDEVKKNWLPQLDITRFNKINKDITEIILQYLNQTKYRDKERSHNIALVQINQLIEEINEKPTRFSYEAFIPLLNKISELINKSFIILEKASVPKVKISMLNESCVVNQDNTVKFQIIVENSKDSSPINNIQINIKNTDDINFIQKNNIYHNSLDGDNYHIFTLFVRISDKVLSDRAVYLDVSCLYSIRNQEEPIEIEEKVSLRFYSENEFEKIENFYAPLADGGPVTDKKMFYGRDQFINNRVDSILSCDSKQIIIYGQKRSGKSSVLYHLKNCLEATNNTFCVYFSLGEIIRDLNEFTFYHKILSTVEMTLRMKKMKGEIVPNYNCLPFNTFHEQFSYNPANGFLEEIIRFKEECSKIVGWETKKIIIMIDEFTYLYTSIRNGNTSDTIMKQWKAITQNEFIKLSVVLVGQDTVPIFKNEPYAKNAFGVIEDIRLTYLNIEDAKKLIIEPILDKDNKNRFIGRAVDIILDYTSSNPYYIQIFCARLVDHMNEKKLIKVTEADVKEVAETFIEGSMSLAPEKFDNLIRAGEEHDYREFDDTVIVKILRQIALNSKNIGFCSRDNISLDNVELEDKILEHLIAREVLEKKQGNNYKIQVRLFQEWLLRH